MRVDLWAFTGKKNRIMAVIRAEGGQVQIEEKEPVPPALRQDIEAQRRRIPGNDEQFLKSLELELSGSYYRAQYFMD